MPQRVPRNPDSRGGKCRALAAQHLIRRAIRKNSPAGGEYDHPIHQGPRTSTRRSTTTSVLLKTSSLGTAHLDHAVWIEAPFMRLHAAKSAILLVDVAT